MTTATTFLSAEQQAAYARDGFLVARGLFYHSFRVLERAHAEGGGPCGNEEWAAFRKGVEEQTQRIAGAKHKTVLSVLEQN